MPLVVDDERPPIRVFLPLSSVGMDIYAKRSVSSRAVLHDAVSAGKSAKQMSTGNIMRHADDRLANMPACNGANGSILSI